VNALRLLVRFLLPAALFLLVQSCANVSPGEDGTSQETVQRNGRSYPAGSWQLQAYDAGYAHWYEIGLAEGQDWGNRDFGNSRSLLANEAQYGGYHLGIVEYYNQYRGDALNGAVQLHATFADSASPPSGVDKQDWIAVFGLGGDDAWRAGFDSGYDTAFCSGLASSGLLKLAGQFRNFEAPSGLGLKC
jgi:hypothetical protein